MMIMTALLYGIRRKLGDAGYVLSLFLFSSPLYGPLFHLTSGPCTHDGHLHYHRIAAMRYAWDNSLFFSRWLPDVAFGLGYPFFLFREALPLYLSLWPHMLGMPLPGAINLVYIGTLLLSGFSMFLWVRDLFGPAAALVSGLAYMAAPYVLIDAYIRGNQPESVGLALLPLLAWAGRRFIIRPSIPSFMVAVLGLATLALSHNISTLLFAPFLLAYLFVAGWLARVTWRPLIGRTVLVLALGLALSLFYIAPALLELDEITISQSTNNRNNDFRFNFTSGDEILAGPSATNPELLNPPLNFRLGWVPVVAAFIAIVAISRFRSPQQRGHILMMAVVAGLFLVMSTAISQPLWERLPLIRFVQFPWRLVGRAALPVAFLAGVPVALLLQESRSSSIWPLAGVSLAVTLLIVETWPMLYPRLCQAESYPTINTVHAYESSTGMVGVDPTGSYFPTTVVERPQDSPLLADYQASRTPQRFDSRSLPPGAGIEEAAYEPTVAIVTLSSPAPFQAQYLSFAYPGWQVTVDGQPSAITPSVPNGFITFPVPAGRHTIAVTWGTTPVRSFFDIVSLLALVFVAITILALRRLRSDIAGSPVVVLSSPSQRRINIIPLFLLGAVLILVKVLLIDRVETPFRRTAPPGVAFVTEIHGAGLQLEGYDLSQELVPSGSTFEIDLAWRVSNRPEAAYQSAIAIVDTQGLRWSEKELFRPRIYEDPAPTNFWQPGQMAWDSWEVQIMPGTPPGQYSILLTLFDLADLGPVTLTDSGGIVIGPSAVIGQIEVTPAASRPSFNPQFARAETINGLLFLGYSQDRAQAAPGDPLLLTWYWEKGSVASPSSELLRLSLEDETGRRFQDWQLPPSTSTYAPGKWAEGERVRGQHLLRLASTLESGEYDFVLEDSRLGALTVNAPQRLFDMPDFDAPVKAQFEGLAELLGYTITRSGDEPTIEITLVWRALSEMDVSYRVFVHLLDNGGQIVSQSDGEPAAWSRPTTGWVPGEFIIDKHRIAAPANAQVSEMSLRVGLYDPLTQGRLAAGSDDAIAISIEK